MSANRRRSQPIGAADAQRSGRRQSVKGRLQEYVGRKLAEEKGLIVFHIRLLFPIGFGDVADVIPVDADLFHVRIVRRAESV